MLTAAPPPRISPAPRRSGARRLAAALTVVAATTAATLASSPQTDATQPTDSDVCAVTTTDRVVAVGDVHGAYDRFVNLLQHAGLIDATHHWAGGRAVFVQLGDLLHRGPDSRQVLDLLRRLEEEAAAAGGRVIVLLGNHEVMRMLRDLRYVSAAEYAAFQSDDSEALREAFYRNVLPQARARREATGGVFDEDAFRKEFLAQIPLGFVEMQIAFEATGEYGEWLRARPAIARVNGMVFVHGGTTPAVAALGCRGINETVARELADPPALDDPRLADTLIAGSDGPLWFRGLAEDPSSLAPDDVARILEDLDAEAIVVGHTVSPDLTIRTRFGTRVIQIDTGMLGEPFYPKGRPSALEISNGVVTAIYLDRRDTLFTRRSASR